MDNTGNFEQQFTQNVKATATQPVYETQSAGTAGNSKLLIAITIALAAIVLVESIALVLTLSNYFSLTNEDAIVEDDASLDEAYSDNAYAYDDDGNVVSINLTCTAEDGSYFTFDLNNKYEEHNSTSAIAGLGSYSITNDSLISLSTDPNRILYYDGLYVADGLTIYECEENVTESNAE